MLARKIGCGPSTIGSWESGEQIPSLLFRKRLEQWSKGKILAKDWEVSKVAKYDMYAIRKRFRRLISGEV
jgi:transcriptional regulator with XRE-family HTH domain